MESEQEGMNCDESTSTPVNYPPGYFAEDNVSEYVEEVGAEREFSMTQNECKALEWLRNYGYPSSKRWLIELRDLEAWRQGVSQFRYLSYQYLDESRVISGLNITRKVFTENWIFAHDDKHFKSDMWYENENEDRNLVKIVPAFTHVLPKVHCLILTRTDEFIDLPEFRNTLCRLVREGDTIEANVDGVGIDKFAYVTLWSRNYDSSINELAKAGAVAAFKKPSLSEGADKSCCVHLSHVETDGTAFVQVHNHTYELFKRVERRVSAPKFTEMKACGPYTLNMATVYLIPYDGAYSRARLHELPPRDHKKVTVFCPDYGNYETVGIENLVPCECVSSVFAKFYDMATQVQLVNIGRIDPYVLFEALNLDKDPKLPLQLLHHVEGELPLIDFLIEEKFKRHPSMELENDSSHFLLTEFALERRIAEQWSQPRFDPRRPCPMDES